MLNPAPFTFHKSTPETVCAIIQTLYQNKHRVRFFYGDTSTGRDWCEENDVTGTVGKSTGTQPIPLLIHNSRSLGGGGLLDSSIVKIIDISTGVTLYQHPSYTCSKFEAVEGSDLPEYAANVTKDGEIYARCKSYASAYRLAAFMNGVRHNK